MKEKIENFDFTPIGQEIKAARQSAGLTREQLAEKLGYAARHLQSIENEGQYPSFKLLVDLAVMFDISIDKYIFPEKQIYPSSVRRQLDHVLDALDDKSLSVLLAAASALLYNQNN